MRTLLLRMCRNGVLSLLIFSACLPGATADKITGSQMAVANQLYEEGNFADAVGHYQALIDAGVDESHLYYNLGNAYFKMGDLGRAILNYLRAQRLRPRDPDIAANLELVRARTVDRFDVSNEGAIVSTVRDLVASTTLDEAALIASFIWMILCGLGIAAILLPQRRRILLMVASAAGVMLFLGVISLGIKILDERRYPPAVVVATETTVRSGPGPDYLKEFTLHAGAEVRLIERREKWARIALPGGLQGWTDGETIVNK